MKQSIKEQRLWNYDFVMFFFSFLLIVFLLTNGKTNITGIVYKVDILYIFKHG